MLSVKQGGIKYHFLTRPEIEPQSPRPLANTLPPSQWTGMYLVDYKTAKNSRSYEDFYGGKLLWCNG